MIERKLAELIKERLGTGKAIVVLGARQVGKTTLLRSLVNGADTLWLNADDESDRALFDEVSAVGFRPYLVGHTNVVIDEAQRIPDIGVKLKILQDAFGDEVQFFATGSSSFDLANKINEPLTGRKWQLQLHPVTALEMVAHHGLLTEQKLLDTRLRFGWYPEVIEHPEYAPELLAELANDYLYKDVLRLGGIRKSAEFVKLVKALAYQVGSEVSMSELGETAGLDKTTAEKYVTLLEQAYIVFRLGSYSNNLRKELKTSTKIYFYDVGIRNALIGDLSAPLGRSDIGHLFENFVIAEIAKQRTALTVEPVGYFWRLSGGGEIDFVTGSHNAIDAYEIKWNPKAKARFPKPFLETYHPRSTTIIHRENALQQLLKLPDAPRL
ncbi:MAG: ATP-binding protein [Propionibacteriaceae bacterium]|jgi:predicted AAA+ superfamily ATPase|nr:ATP-binding protein [Propionibacteriaceae bacterium]